MATKWRVIYSPEAYEDILLLTPDEFQRLPIGAVLVSISGFEYVKGKDYIDDDTRGGHLAYGLTQTDTHKYESYLGGGLWNRTPAPSNTFLGRV